MEYTELVLHTVSNRGRIVPITDVPKILADEVSERDEYFCSLYTFDDELKRYADIHRTVRSYGGPCGVRKLVFDFDRGVDTHEYLAKRVDEFCNELRNDWNIQPEIYFSGRGFHVTIPDIFRFPFSVATPQSVASTLTACFPMHKFDLLQKNRMSLIRMHKSYNMKSGLYKIRINQELLFEPLPQLESLAQRRESIPPLTYGAIPDYSSRRIDIPTTHVVAGLRVDTEAFRADTRYVACVQKMYKGGPIAGSRHQMILRIASAWRRGGVPEEAARMALQAWAHTMQPYEVESVVKDIYKRDFKYSCHDTMMAMYCDPGCIFYGSKNYTPEVMDTKLLESKFTVYARGAASHASFDLKDVWNLEKPYVVYPGELVIVLGDTGVGKSTLVQNLSIKVPRQVLYMPLENGEMLAYRRFVQIAHGVSKHDVLEHYRLSTDGYAEALSHIRIATTAPQLEALGRLIAESGCQIAIIDTLDSIPGAGDENQRLSNLIRELEVIAKRQQVILIGIHHISKFATMNDLNLHSGRGPKMVEDKADKVIGIEKIGEGYDRRVFALKSRDEEPFECVLRMDPITMRMERIDGTIPVWKGNL